MAPATEVFAVEYTYSPAPELIAQNRPSHREFLGGLFETGHLLASGPIGLDEGALLIVRGESEQAVRDILAPDAFLTSGLVTDVRVRHWKPVFGPWA